MLRIYLAPIQDDTEEAPWMVMGTPQWNTASAFYDALATYLRAADSPIFVSAMLPIRFRPNSPDAHIEQLAPDVMVARVPTHDRSSYNVEQEGVAPCFVLEVVSPESRRRNTEDKPTHYERMGIEEFHLFTSASRTRGAMLKGYTHDRRTDSFVPWESDERGRLWSESLDLWLALRDEELRLQRADGMWLWTHAESEAAVEDIDAERLAEQASREAAEAGWKREVAAREREQAARRAAEAERLAEQKAREAAEAETARLRAQLER